MRPSAVRIKGGRVDQRTAVAVEAHFPPACEKTPQWKGSRSMGLHDSFAARLRARGVDKC